MGKQVLVVDDSTFMRYVVVSTLKKGGYEVIEVTNGQEGLEQLKDHRVHLIISDLNMPQMDGLTFVKHVRESITNRFTPILMLTTESGEDKKQEGKVAGVNGWMQKPFDSQMLLQSVTKMVR